VRKISLIFLVIFSFMFIYGLAKNDRNELPLRYKKWLDEEVIYIISPIEKEVFLKLKTDRERDLFIQAFWKHRDPTPGTPENEFKTEHYSRINYANHFFGRGTPKPGWKTDRGRMYIILGEPNDIERFEGKSQTYPAEVWFYQGKTKLGLPPGFHLVFFQKGGIGEYILYSPLKDGPQALMTSYYGDPMDYLAAYQQLQEFEPDLAQVSLTLIPGEESAAFGHPSLSSDLLIQKVETVPIRQIEDKYAQKFLAYKDVVEVEYSANYIDNNSLIKITRQPSGLYFVNYAIEPETLSVTEYQSKYSTNLKLNGTVTAKEGKRIYQFEKNIALSFNQEQMKEISHRPLSIYDMFPLIPGSYRLSILLKNEVSKEFTSLERTLDIPQAGNSVEMTPLIIGYKTVAKPRSDNRLRPFQLGHTQLYFQANRVFLRQDNIIVAFQLYNLSPELQSKGRLKYTFFRGEEEFRSTPKPVSHYPELPNIVQSFSLQDFPPAHYKIKVAFTIDNQEIVTDSEEFDITYSESIARPWIYSKVLAPAQDPVYFYLIGSQLFNSGRIEEAKVQLERAFQRKPDSIEFALNLARVYMRLGAYKQIEKVLLPFIKQPQTPSYEVFFIMGRAYQSLGQLTKAVDIFNQAITHYGLNIHLLNALAESYLQLGNKEEALTAWQKSLDINPNQPQIRKNIEALKEKK